MNCVLVCDSLLKGNETEPLLKRLVEGHKNELPTTTTCENNHGQKATGKNHQFGSLLLIAEETQARSREKLFAWPCKKFPVMTLIQTSISVSVRFGLDYHSESDTGPILAMMLMIIDLRVLYKLNSQEQPQTNTRRASWISRTGSERLAAFRICNRTKHIVMFIEAVGKQELNNSRANGGHLDE
ncbi:hypothetical protein EVAR_55397_1 [Eumeta japonica]|uniref:Uncharacterized protein n=1 Tax=Eumeta variegata TaxID=151549 RepID=A0A4C1YRY6_EUMVA|nr:hypothetical protein EVAR_55397_1 [Eumeta japonica]